MKICVTGSEGLIGWHLRCALLGMAGWEVEGCNRDRFQDDAGLAASLRDCDAVVHLAGMNRGEPEEVASTNVELTRRLARFVGEAGISPHFLFSSSTHIDRDTAYGASKRECAALLAETAEQMGGRFTNLVLPHVYGEHGKPFYNSVVSTFCHQLARGEIPVIDQDGDLNLFHAQDVADLVIDCLDTRREGEIRPGGAPLKVSELKGILEEMSADYAAQLVPALQDPLRRNLFNTYRSYLTQEQRAVSPPLRSDDRGWLFEGVRSHQPGQMFVSSTHPGITRGNHFHRRKVERFLVVQGEAVIRMRRMLTDETLEFRVTGSEPTYVDMPTLWTHNITNVGEGELLTMFWANEIFDPNSPDTFFESV